jgi:isopentenyl diphosphate isomerase/L-lactate dehydrogenase-like FMN-dependent dehydrogenase
MNEQGAQRMLHAVAGEQGVPRSLEIIAAERDTPMALCGCTDIASVAPQILAIFAAPMRAGEQEKSKIQFKWRRGIRK